MTKLRLFLICAVCVSMGFMFACFGGKKGGDVVKPKPPKPEPQAVYLCERSTTIDGNVSGAPSAQKLNAYERAGYRIMGVSVTDQPVTPPPNPGEPDMDDHKGGELGMVIEASFEIAQKAIYTTYSGCRRTAEMPSVTWEQKIIPSIYKSRPTVYRDNLYNQGYKYCLNGSWSMQSQYLCFR